jgi:hypothetical protein
LLPAHGGGKAISQPGGERGQAKIALLCSSGSSLYLRAEYFNVFNHPMFDPPQANYEKRIYLNGFGTITSTLDNFLRGDNSLGSLSPLYQTGGPVPANLR